MFSIRINPELVQAMDEQTAYVMTYMMKGVIENGTGSRLVYKYGINKSCCAVKPEQRRTTPTAGL